MADSVLSVRIDEELKKKFVELAAAHEVGNKDLLQMMLAHFELEKVKSEDDGFGRDIEELQRLCRRIADLYVNLAERSSLRRLEEENKEQQWLEASQKVEAAMLVEISGLKTQVEAIAPLEQSLKEQSAAMKKVMAELGTVKELNQLLQEKNQKLEGVVSEQKAAVEQVAQKEGEIQELRDRLREKAAEVERQDYRLGLLQDEKVQKAKEFERSQSETERRFREQLAMKEKEFELALKEQRLMAQLEQAANLEALKARYEGLMAELKENKSLLDA